MQADKAEPFTTLGGVSVLLREQVNKAPDPDHAESTLAASLKLVMLRWLDHLPKAQVALVSARLDATNAAEVLDQITGTCFLCALDGARDQVGLAHLTHSMAQGLAELHALGQILPKEPTAQKPTRTDAALLMPLLQGFLERLAQPDTTTPILPGLADLNCGVFLPEARSAALVLEDRPLQILRCTFRLGASDRTGHLSLILHDRKIETAQMQERQVRQAAAQDWDMRWPDIVLGSQAQLNAILHRQTMTLAQLGTLQPGTVLGIPDACMEGVRLETMSGQMLAVGRLGQSRGQRALRLAAPPGDMVAAPSAPALPRGCSAIILPATDTTMDMPDIYLSG